jgi:hypothetical protein
MSEATHAYDSPDGLVVPWELDDGRLIELLTPEQFAALPDGVSVWSIFGEQLRKGIDDVDQDTRAGRLAFGIPDRRYPWPVR